MKGVVVTETWLECDACGAKIGPYETYEEWADAADRLDWEVGEETVICPLCAGR